MSKPACKKLLYVDDARYMHRVLKLSLPENYAIECVDNGLSALEIMQQQRFDIIISDINMPNMTGLELLSKIRQLPNYKKTPVLLMSAEENPDYRQQGKKLGADGFIIKPFKPDLIEQCLTTLLNKNSDA
ncbi:response regulator [Thiomicrorhabdus sediminis]|uniref:Response regulator n=1 Tax=Thiomicrorhabdus sediminis TaxID=2580412 RepID=A0A4P9K658_9GAMM|nr:response regulator [Thiomicrorhabdus sediminis]QCU90311.1 response regulator [Thiomicrorhabdus sediminis]